MDCEVCQKNFYVGERVELLGQFICNNCGSYIVLENTFSIYLGLDLKSGDHKFEIHKPQKCSSCDHNLVIANIPCGDTYSGLFKTTHEIKSESTH